MRPHAFLCVLALTMERVMRLELEAAGGEHSPRRALEELGKLMHVRLTLPGENRRPDSRRWWGDLGGR